MCVIMSLLPCVFKSCLLSSMSSGLLVITGVSVSLYLALSHLDVVIKDYYFEVISSSACSSFLPAVCTVTWELRLGNFETYQEFMGIYGMFWEFMGINWKFGEIYKTVSYINNLFDHRLTCMKRIPL